MKATSPELRLSANPTFKRICYFETNTKMQLFSFEAFYFVLSFTWLLQALTFSFQLSHAIGDKT